MALLKCSECNQDVSANAESCPHCGNPINKKIVTIERTSKKWKLIKLIAVLLMLFGMSLGVNNKEQGNELAMWFWFNMAALGLILFFVGKFGAWWNNR